ncbi:type II toxin-antitoxin system RelE/ParE family toxin [Rubrivivax sp. JA1024]|nr:type II toxin-antitoxin system RelE/ParE family toxin [Rubrivivax sp. JA1024]
MAHKRRINPKARADLDEIWSFIAADSERSADAVISLITDAMAMLAINPAAGRRRAELSLSLRSFPVGNYLIFYSAEPDGIRIVRVLHGRQDISRKDVAP